MYRRSPRPTDPSHGARALRRIASATLGRARRGDDGFTLLETIISISIVTIVMISLTTLFANSIATSSHLQKVQTATSLVTTALDNARSIGAVNVSLGRSQASVDAQFEAMSGTPVAAWLSSMDRLYGDTHYDPDLPATPVEQTVGNTTYSVNYVVGTCHRKFTYLATSEDCTNQPKDDRLSYVNLVRVVVAVSWPDGSCSDSTCFRISAILLNGDEDPQFNLNNGEPPKPNLHDCSPQTVTIGDVVDIAVFGVRQPDEQPPLCTLDGGVPPFTWTWDSLPEGLSIGPDGHVTGTVGGDPGSVTSSVTVADVYGAKSTGNAFTWTVKDAQPTIVDPGDQATRVGADMLLTTPSTCPSGDCSYTLGGFPATMTDPDGNEIPLDWAVTADPTTGNVTVTGPAIDVDVAFPGLTITVTSGSGLAAITAPFTWAVTSGPILQRPGNQFGHAGESVSLAIAGDCGSAGPCTFSLSGAPGMSIDPTSGVITGITPAGPTVLSRIAVTMTDSQSPPASDTAVFDWTIYEQPSIDVIGPQSWIFGKPISPLSIDVHCGWDPCTTAPSGSLPAGVQLADGVISGTPTALGSGTFTISVTDGGNGVGSTSFNWTVASDLRLTIPDQANRVGDNVSFDLAGMTSGGVGKLTYSSSGLPTGTRVSSSGVVSGNPSTASTYGNAIITVTDDSNRPVQAKFTWSVVPKLSLSMPSSQTTPKSSTRNGSCRNNGQTAITLTNYTTGADGNQSYSITKNPSLGSANISGKTLTLTAPCSTGSTTVTVEVTDRAGTPLKATASSTFTWKVTN